MPIEVRGTKFINELMSSVSSAPDFSFLNDWRPDQNSTFFPRLNNSPEAKRSLNGEDRKKLRVAIDSIEEVHELIEDASIELIDPKSGFSNSISVFHRDGEVSVVAIPVTETTSRSLGGFLFSRDIWEMPNAQQFLHDLQVLNDLTPSAEGYLRWRWWPVKKDQRETNKLNSTQLLLAATNPGNRNIHHIADLVDARANLAAGRMTPELSDWQEALLQLDSLKDLPADSVISSIDFVGMPELKSSIELIAIAFALRDEYLNDAKEALEVLAEARTVQHLQEMSIEEFAKKSRGRGFAMKRIREMVLSYSHESQSFLYSGFDPDAPVSVGDVVTFATENPEFFRTKQLVESLNLINVYAEDQKRLLGYPRLSDNDPAFQEFLRLVYRYYREQQRPYPVRNQFETLAKLLQSEPEQLHLVARSEDALHKLVGSIESYLDEERLAALNAPHGETTVEEAREFFQENPATYQSVLSAMGLNALTLEQISGFLAPEATAAIRAIEVDLAGMKSALRSYQLFGVQYALNQKRIILGDEMGLGKTVTALALANHLSREDEKHFLVILPLAVLENWRLETSVHSSFVPHMLYGDELEDNLESWVKNGGLALATYESIQKVNRSPLASDFPTPALVIVDEAHNLKNPETLRARHALPWMRAAPRLVMLTGTPLENKIEEFETLIHYAQPQLEVSKDKLDYSGFRKAIAPVYLRRNQVDVLQELPALLNIEEYIELSPSDKEYYTRALKAGDWHLARRAKILAGNRSSSVQWIQSKVEESVENGHKVLIFSFYRETLDVLQRVLKQDDPFTPLTGSLSSAERIAEVQKFTKAKKAGVLLAQSTAGGTGLNIQAASVVIIVEPQSKVTQEEQMIRRAYRMGQVNPVQVYRMRGKDTIDEHWVNGIQSGKRELFDNTAGVSDAASLGRSAESDILAREQKKWGV